MHWIHHFVAFLPCPLLNAISRMQLYKWANIINVKKKVRRITLKKGSLDNMTKHLNKLNNIWMKIVSRARPLVSALGFCSVEQGK